MTERDEQWYRRATGWPAGHKFPRDLREWHDAFVATWGRAGGGELQDAQLALILFCWQRVRVQRKKNKQPPATHAPIRNQCVIGQRVLVWMGGRYRPAAMLGILTPTTGRVRFLDNSKMRVVRLKRITPMRSGKHGGQSDAESGDRRADACHG